MGDDSGSGDPPIDAIDAPSEAIMEDFGSDEGGEVRLEYIKFANGTGVGARGTAFFYKNSGTTKFFPFLSLDGCTDLSGVNGNGKWPKAQNPDSERMYYDVGDTVTATGGSQPFVIAKNTTGMPAKDPIGRSELANSWYFNRRLPRTPMVPRSFPPIPRSTSPCRARHLMQPTRTPVRSTCRLTGRSHRRSSA